MNLLLQLIVNGFVNASLFALMAIGFGLVYRSLNIFHIAYGSIFVLSAYFLYFFITSLNLPLSFAIFFPLLSSAIVGLLMEKLVYVHFFNKKSSSGVVMIASLGIFIVVENTIAALFGNDVKIVSHKIGQSFVLHGIILTKIQVLEIVAGIILVSLFLVAIRKIKTFKAIWAMGDEPELISIVGIPLYKLRAVVFIVSSIYMALPAILISFDVGIDPHIGMTYLLIAAVSVLFGGIDSVWGWILASVILAELQSLTVWKFSSKWIDLVTFTILVLVLIFRPQGLLGKRKRLEEMK